MALAGKQKQNKRDAKKKKGKASSGGGHKANRRIRAPHDSSPQKDRRKRFRVPQHTPKPAFSPMIRKHDFTLLTGICTRCGAT
jgi:hypothetical protein